MADFKVVAASCYLVFATLATAGCASVPVESVELSETVGRDLESLHVAHKELAVRYFQRMHRDVDEFVRDVYRPYVIRSTMEDLGLVAKLQASLQPGSELDPLDVMEIYVEEAMKQIETYRAELQAPVTEQEVQVLGSIDASHLRVQNANAIVTGHLASVRKVHDAQGEFLARARLGGLQERTASFVTSVSDELARTLDSARSTESELKLLPSRVGEIVKRITQPVPPAGTAREDGR
jgi:hypothetical protein